MHHRVTSVFLQIRQRILHLVGVAGAAEQTDDADAEQQAKGDRHHQLDQAESVLSDILR